ncbi:uncharacterized protein K02A2.6 isoform X1 [Bicyclus anynana]|uniref:RNA-directed DNA polymerase n=1 Tax=Bicyclus anynana TaxID=110368 RepID=A0ABM3M7Q3_BICAN|nr:uncharacterized protein K02A2.6 isoform X1 [Bicyclus anynana]
MDISNLCRSCMKEVASWERENFDARAVEMFCFCTNIKIMEDIKLPKQFCYDCTIKIESCFTFIKEAQNVNITLKNIASRSDTSIIIEPESVKNCLTEPNRLRLTLPDYKLSIGVSNYTEQDIFDETDYNRNESAILTTDLPILPTKTIELLQSTEKCNLPIHNELERNSNLKLDTTISSVKIEPKRDDNITVGVPERVATRKNNVCKTDVTVLDEAKKLACPVCRKQFTSKKWYSKHMDKEHSGHKYNCEHCPKSFSKPLQLAYHAACHSDERKFMCNTCGKGFKRRKQLTEHGRAHSDARPYACDQCGMSIQSETKILPFVVELLLEDIPVVLQVDTGASFSLVNEYTWKKIKYQNKQITLRPVSLTLRTWTNTPVILLGQTTLHVQYRNLKCNLNVIIAKGCGPNLLGRDWLNPLNITLNINCISSSDLVNIDKTISKYSEIFEDELGTFTGDPVTIHLKPNATPRFLKARPVPYAIKARVEQEIDRLVAEGVLQPLSFSEWATPVVPIIKKSGDIRLCGDYRSTVNQATESDTFPMPTANEVFATVAGAKFFTTLDLDRAYTQVKVTESTAKMLTLNTCKGLYSVHRLPFGVKACPGIFQRLMTALLAGIQGVSVLIDDIIVSGPTILIMQQRLDNVLKRIQKAGFHLNKNKCKFAQEKVEFLGFVINGDGIHPAPSKVEAILKTPEPKNVRELQAFLGLYNFYERFIPHKATTLEPLHRLLDKSQTWRWTQREQDAFNKAKQLLTFETTLVHYDLNKHVILTCDSSEYGVGAVLSHVMDEGHERPIAMSSRTLNAHERRYSQLDKEATAIMFGIKKFHNYIAGRQFTIVTDHKPLLGIFDPKRPMPSILSPRLTRIAIALTAHDYSITYQPGSQIGNADSLSRWPLPVPEQEDQSLCEVLLMAEKVEDFPYTAHEIASETTKDQTLSRIVHFLRCGWPGKVTDRDLRTYWLHRTELSLQDGCILLGCRVVIPPSLRQTILRMLHTTHNGIVHTKALARSYVWWPQLSDDISRLVQNCTKCLENRRMPEKSSHEWILPSRPWSRIHIDFAGPYMNKTFLIVVDAFSKWPEVFIVSSTNSRTVIGHLRNLFATHGICETLVSDNGTSFVSQEMKLFLESNKIRHVTSAPYHPATNGLAERMVQTVKDKLRKIHGPWEVKIPNMLLGLRVTPCSSTNKSPSELLMNRRLRTVMDTLHPDNIQHKNRKSSNKKCTAEKQTK